MSSDEDYFEGADSDEDYDNYSELEEEISECASRACKPDLTFALQQPSPRRSQQNLKQLLQSTSMPSARPGPRRSKASLIRPRRAHEQRHQVLRHLTEPPTFHHHRPIQLLSRRRGSSASSKRGLVSRLHVPSSPSSPVPRQLASSLSILPSVATTSVVSVESVPPFRRRFSGSSSPSESTLIDARGRSTLTAVLHHYRLVVKTTSQLAALASLPEDLLKSIGSVTIALGDLNATAREVPLVRAMMESISSVVEDIKPTEEDDTDSLFALTEEELAVKRREAAFDLTISGMDRSDLFELRSAVRSSYDAPFRSTRLADHLQLQGFESLNNSALNKLDDVQITFPASCFAAHLLPSLSRQLLSLEIICPPQLKQVLPEPIGITLSCTPCELSLAAAGTTAIANLPATLTNLTLEGVTITPDPYSTPIARAAPYDLREIALTRITYSQGEAGGEEWGPRRASSSDSLPSLVGDEDVPKLTKGWSFEEVDEPADRLDMKSAFSAFSSRASSQGKLGADSSLFGLMKSAWGANYDDFKTVSDSYVTDKDGKRLPGKLIHDERPFELKGSEMKETTDKGKGKSVEHGAKEKPRPSNLPPLDFHLFTGAAQDTLRILRLDSCGSTFDPKSIAHAISANSEALEEIVVVEDAANEEHFVQSLWAEKGERKVRETVFMRMEDLSGDSEEEEEKEDADEREGAHDGTRKEDDLGGNLKKLDLGKDSTPAPASAPIPSTLSPFAQALSRCTELSHLRLSDHSAHPSSYPADIVDALLIAMPLLSLLEIRLAAPKLSEEALQEWKKTWEPKARELLDMVQEGGFARISLVEEIA